MRKEFAEKLLVRAKADFRKACRSRVIGLRQDYIRFCYGEDVRQLTELLATGVMPEARNFFGPGGTE